MADVLTTSPPQAPEPASVTQALTSASASCRLQECYMDCVRPLLRQPRTQWPGCCGGGCEPCSATLVAVADETLRLLGRAEPWVPAE